jgi:hypothetical protein
MPRAVSTSTLGGQHLGVRAGDVVRRVGGELVRAVGDLDVDVARSDGGLEVALADVAEGTRDVGPDVDVNGCHGGDNRRCPAGVPASFAVGL